MIDLDLLLAAADSIAPRRPDGDVTTPSLYQERLWRAHLAAPSTAYSVPCVFDLEGEDTDRVVAAALAVLRAQEVFDTRIADTEGGAFTLVAAGPITPEYFDVDVSTIDGATEELVQRAWASGPLVRLGVLRCAGGADRIALVFHHAVIDGHSVSLLIGEIARELRDPGSAARTSRPRYRDSASTRTESAKWWREYLSTVRHDEVWRPAAGGSSVVTRSAIAAVGSQDAAT